ncbi:MAG: hypothetical protein LBU51_08270, partial [Bacteroidales bacterium]|nr:hypothetical protein [Bacteroidales bacterium]
MMKKIFTLISIVSLLLVYTTGYAQDTCQHFAVEILSNTISKQYPTLSDNNLYFNTCQGRSNKFYVNANFYENELHGYTQTIENTVFTWKFSSSENTYNLTGDTVEVPFNLFNGWDIWVDAVDVNGCPVDLLEKARVRVSANPFSHINPVAPICPGDTIMLGVSYDSSDSTAFVYIETQESDTNTVMVIVDPTFLPDGSGVNYHSTVTYDIFSPGTTLTNISDFIRVTAALEHSYLGDLRIWLECPSHQTVDLKPTSGGGQTNLGEPRECSSGIDGCSPTACSQLMGTCYNYGFTPTSTFGPMLQTSNWTSPSWYYECNQNGAHLQGANQHVIGDRDYAPAGSFNALLGCPLNGDWTLWVRDNLALDNGWICEWSIELNPDLVPGLWAYTVELDTLVSLNASITVVDKHTLMVTNTVPSIDSFYRFAIVDEYGCFWDSAFVLTTANPYKPVLGPDITYCDETTVTIGPNIDDPYNGTATFEWTSHYGEANHGSDNQSITVSDSGQFVVEMWMNYLNDSLRCKSLDTIILKKWNAIHIFPQEFLH